ncbi:MAG: hypothetical protein A4E49_01092 [Methanosaeta sp. PtaU1.Bin112]|nr:MAG: hypothetical protein A4E49_01092 [Methanosaeta sp. PtaU1.Bin112]
MSTFPNSPRLMKGAIIGVDPFNPLASIVIFQYNPDTLNRSITPQTSGGDADKGEALRLKGPPQETIKLEVEIDATDQLEQDKTLAKTTGIYSTLASLEMLLYPKSALVIANEALQLLGVVEIIPAEAPMTFFVWGIKRILPVRIIEMSIAEEAFDQDLNPIRARVSLGLKVLNYQDLGLMSAGGALFMAHQVIKETMATINGLGGISGSASFSFDLSLG